MDKEINMFNIIYSLYKCLSLRRTVAKSILYIYIILIINIKGMSKLLLYKAN